MTGPELAWAVVCAVAATSVAILWIGASRE